MASEKTLRYIKLDYQSHKDALLQRIRERYPGKWNDFLANSFGIVIVDIAAWGLATLAYTINFIGAENFISTMRLRESAVRIGRLVGYNLRSATPATVACEAVLGTALSANVVIKRGTQVRSSDSSGLPFEVSADYTIEAGNLSPQTLVVTFSPTQAGANVLSTFVVVTAGSENVDLVDTSIDLSRYIQSGQTFTVDGVNLYTIASLEKIPGAISDFSRIVLSRVYSGDSTTTEAEVIDTRILLVQGQSVSEKFIAPTGSTAGYSVKLSRTPVLDNSVEVQVNGSTWMQRDSIGTASALDNVYQLRTLSSGVTVVIFGDGVYGSLLPAEAPITIAYRVGGGIDGNIDLGKIDTSLTGYIESLASPVTVRLSNTTTTGVGGQNAETLDQARISIPAYARTNDRAVTVSDYQTLAQQFSSATYGSVAYARAVVNRNNALLEGNILSVYAWTVGVNGGLVQLSAPMKSALQAYLQSKSVGTDYVQIYDGSARPVPISLRFKVFSGASVTSTKQAVTNSIVSFVTALRPGDPIYYSDLLRRIDETAGVDTVDMATPIKDLYPSSELELFSVPQDTYVYTLERTAASSPQDDGTGLAKVSMYTAQLPVYPLSAWSFRLFLGTSELTIVPHTQAGYARLSGQNLSTVGRQVTNDGIVDFSSTVNLLTGQVQLWLRGAPGDLSMRLITVQGYSAERAINVYVGYIGENTQTKRQEIRSALRAWSDGLGVGSAMYARQVTGITASVSNVSAVVSAVSGVDSVTRVALGAAANTEDRVTAADFEVLRIGSVIINNTSA